jgi:hypothetical protein
MADNKLTTSMTAAEIGNLAERLQSRADSILNTMPNQCADMQTAAKILKALIRAGLIKENIQV